MLHPLHRLLHRKAGMNPTERLEFDDEWVRNVEPPESGRRTYYDTISTSLVLIVTHRGAKSFYRAGRPSRVFIGHPDQGWKVSHARTQCNIIVGKFAAGENPIKAKQEARAKSRNDRTLGEAWEWFLNQYAKRHKKSWQNDIYTWNSGLCEWKDRKLASITREDYKNRLNSLVDKRGRDHARHQMTLFNSICKQIEDIGWITENPGKGVTLPQSKKRKRYLLRTEVPRFFKALSTMSQDLQDLVKWAIFTGARRDNVASCRISEIRKDVWLIPPEKAKEGDEISIPLMPVLMDILKRRKAMLGKTATWLFPYPCKARYWKFFDREWHQLLEKAKLNDFRFHDLRHTLASWQAGHGVSLRIIGETLGHKDTKSTERYTEVELSAVRAAVRTATEAIQKAAAETKSKKSRK